MQYSSLLISHEISHHWFGDLVTMSSFADIWLNEAFAEFLQYSPFAESDFPLGDLKALFFLNEFELSMYQDSSSYTHALVPKKIPKSVHFDDITYNKGSAIIRQMAAYVDYSSNISFYKALGLYLNHYKYQSVTTIDFFSNMGKILGLDLYAVASKWIYVPGYPIVFAEFEYIESNSSVLLYLSQERFVFRISKDTVWPIHVRLALFTRNEEMLIVTNLNLGILDIKQSTFSVSIPKNERFVAGVLNPDRIGFFRTRYSSLESLRPVISSMSPLDRAGFISDSIEIFLAGQYKSFNSIKTILEFISNENSCEIWLLFMKAMSRLEIGTRKSVIHPDLINSLHNILNPILNSIITEGASHPLGAIQGELFRFSLKMNNQFIIKYCLNNYDTIRISSPLYYVVWAGAVRFGNSSLFDKMLSLPIDNSILSILASTSSEDNQRMLLTKYGDHFGTFRLLAHTMLELGESKGVWDFWISSKMSKGEDNSHLSEILEFCVVQLSRKEDIFNANRFAPRFDGIKRALERRKFFSR